MAEIYRSTSDLGVKRKVLHAFQNSGNTGGLM